MRQLDSATDEFGQMEDVRSRIVAAAATLIASGGRDAATTRAVATAAGVQAPTIYRLFGDKSGLLDAVAQDGLASYVAAKAVREPHPDPVQELRDGWDMHVAFGMAHPGLFSIMAGDPRPRSLSPAAAAGLDLLRQRVRNIALTGRLRVSEARALGLLESVCLGAILTLLRQPEGRRDPGLSEMAREAVIAAITGDTVVASDAGPSSAAATLHAALNQTAVLTDGERHLMEELLNRIANGGGLSAGETARA